MALRLGDTAPDFHPGIQRRHHQLSRVAGQRLGRAVFPSGRFHAGVHDGARTTAKLKDEFAKRNTKAIALSVDPANRIANGSQDINDTGRRTVNFPIIADADRKVSELYDMIHPERAPRHGALAVRHRPGQEDPSDDHYPASDGRNFDEILRVIDSLQLTDTTRRHARPTGSRRRRRDHPFDAGPRGLKQKFPNFYPALRPYLRITPQPNR